MRTLRLIPYVAALAAVALVAAGPGPAVGKVAGTDGRIVFTRTDFGAGTDTTYVVDTDGSHLARLFPDYSSSAPHWSPDGSHVAVVTGLAQQCPPDCRGNTAIIDPSDGSYRVLATQGPPGVFTYCSLWSPDATRFACDGELDGDPSVNGVYTVRSSDGAGLVRVTDAGGGVDVPIDWSPDGRRLVFGRFGPLHVCTSTSAIYVVNLDGTGLHRITPPGFCDDDGSWSPDGSRIAFVRDDGMIFTVRPDGSGLAQLPLGPVPDALNSRTYAGDVTWSPDGTHISFLVGVRTGKRAGEEGIATANADGSHITWVTQTDLFDHEGDWGPAH